MNHINELMEQFIQLAGAEVGKGPQHPIIPDKNLAEEVDIFLTKYSFLHNYPDYTAFLQRYAGAAICRQPPEYNGQTLVFLLGFSPDSWHFYEEMNDDRMVDKNGFFEFAVSLFENEEQLVQLSYSFPVTADRPIGVYRGMPDEKTQLPNEDFTPPKYEWHCSSFSDFIKEIIRNDGIMK